MYYGLVCFLARSALLRTDVFSFFFFFFPTFSLSSLPNLTRRTGHNLRLHKSPNLSVAVDLASAAASTASSALGGGVNALDPFLVTSFHSLWPLVAFLVLVFPTASLDVFGWGRLVPAGPHFRQMLLPSTMTNTFRPLHASVSGMSGKVFQFKVNWRPKSPAALLSIQATFPTPTWP